MRGLINMLYELITYLSSISLIEYLRITTSISKKKKRKPIPTDLKNLLTIMNI